MTAKRRVNVIYADNGSGLSRDAAIIAGTLESGRFDVWLTPLPPRRFPLAWNYLPELGRQSARALRHSVTRSWARRVRPWDVNVFLERLVPEYFDAACANCLIPNQEWLDDEERRMLRDIDLVLFKTRGAAELLQPEVKAAAYLGFTSLDRLDPSVRRRPAALHVSGWNPYKGTAAVLHAWSRRPRWPVLTVVSQLHTSRPDAENVSVLSRRISDAALGQLQNAHAVHVCPSEVEGFGHTLAEALSCGAAVVTINAPPMNELITPDEGVLIPYTSTARMGSGTRYFVDSEQLVDALERVWRFDCAELRRFGAGARSRFEQMQSAFRVRLRDVLAGV